MPAIQDKQRKTWIAQFYYVDYRGVKKRKRKRGFKNKRDALRWEREFLLEHAEDVTMTFGKFVDIYLKDCKNRIKESSQELKTFIIENKIRPYFENLPLSEITPRHIRDWQNELLAYRDENGEPYSPTYLKTIHTQLSTIFNYAVRFYNLKENPCVKAGSIGKYRAEEMKMWTLEEFNKFLDALGDENPPHRLALITLFYSGLRIGELLALTPKDISFNDSYISVTKTYRRYHKKDYISPPKTAKSVRDVSIPSFLLEALKDFIDERQIGEDERIFTFTHSALSYTVKKYSKIAGLERIRLHDFRHSHASLLVQMGFNVNLIADRLGHEKVETTLNIYSHLYPKARSEVAEKLNKLEFEHKE